MKIEYFETANNLEHNVSGVNFRKVSEENQKKRLHRVKGLRLLEFDTASYPDIAITRFDFCDDKEEGLNIEIKFIFEVTKKEFFDIVAALRQMDCLWFEECFPIKVRLETNIDNPDKFAWLYAKNLKNKEERLAETFLDQQQKAQIGAVPDKSDNLGG